MPLQIDDNASLGSLNTFGVAARAARLIVLDDAGDTRRALQAWGAEGPALVIGGGSNLLLTRDIDGAVLKVATRGVRVIADDNEWVVVEAAAGEPWHAFVMSTLALGLYGLENLSLIPGLVGASPIQNVGAYGVEIVDSFESLQAIHLRSGETREFDRDACQFGYRDSWFKHADGMSWLVIAVRFRLSRRAAVKTGYGEIGAELARQHIIDPTPQQVSQAICEIRRRKLPDPAIIGNAGSFFKNPIVTAAHAAALRQDHPGLPVYAGSNDTAKLPAAWLIEQCGWKGFREGDAGVHPQHALVLVNHGRASGADLLALSERIADSVWQRFDVRLDPEPRII